MAGRMKGIGGVLMAAVGGAASAGAAELAVSKVEFAQQNWWATPAGLLAAGLLLGSSRRPMLRALGAAAGVAGGVIGYQSLRMKQNADNASGGPQQTSGVVDAPMLEAPGTSGLDDFDLSASDAGAVNYAGFGSLGRAAYSGQY